MKTISIRDLRQHWPDAEATLKEENEILITRDSKPVAKLIYISPATKKRARWDVEEHARWQKRVSRGARTQSEAALAESRADRPLGPKNK